MSLDEATMAVGCEDGSLHGMKLSQGGVGVQHVWSKPAAAGGSSVLAMDMSADGKVGGSFSTERSSSCDVGFKRLIPSQNTFRAGCSSGAKRVAPRSDWYGRVGRSATFGFTKRTRLSKDLIARNDT